jgi:hypothetical protein
MRDRMPERTYTTIRKEEKSEKRLPAYFDELVRVTATMVP